MKFITVAALAACVTFFALSARNGASSPLDGYMIVQSNGVAPFVSISVDGRRDVPLTNWMIVTSDTSPKVITAILRSPKNTIARPGQVWVSGEASYLNVPSVFEFPGDTTYGGFKHTNDWPEITRSTQLVYVKSIHKAEGGWLAGQDYYARCHVRIWNHSAYLDGESWLLLSFITNRGTLIRD